ncbi:aminoglycoside phosphotransferase family protein [Curtobacterium sp. VKM Ac-2887]|uniref:aminoglycoside phosphotransferase family protein n=1 Tax=Curtobacterium sp. VKM Ac-2887 TaxID=2783819 RepID=UPI00188D9E8E|nr:aminoglycoside phosphotransferase family protein [Curtobacterium sp. VKM Ac-2887]MBF4585146.1 aminoglycoside phosphotransferase family protein [Curtobacterium sp. VKM Ac-2887]
MLDDDTHRHRLDAVLRAVGSSDDQAERLLGGSVNHTYRVRRAVGADVVVRFPVDALRSDEFPVEAWAARAAAAAGIEVPRPLDHGIQDGVPFIVSEYVEPDPRPIDHPWTWLGSSARTVASIDLGEAPASLFTRFGTDLARAWSAHLAYNSAALVADDPLRRDGAYNSAGALRRHFERLAAEHFAFGLAHGDLAPRNLIARGPGRAPVLIDWGAAETGPSPWTDARRVFEWAFVDATISRAEYDEFTAAAGLATPADHAILASLTALHLVDVTRWAREQRPDLYAEYVDRCRVGLERVEHLERIERASGE